MSLIFDTSQWLGFFTKAGLPPNVAANYALIFSDNRIQLDMLMELSKEYLYDMGIRIMGDVIAILRYAKEFHTKMAQERAIGSPAVQSSQVVGRMVGHYTRSHLLPKPATSVKLKAIAPTVISLKRSASVEVPVVKKPRRVPPEEEGAYNIKMPAGTTERSRSKRSVFSRLGDSSVSSSTDATKVTKPLSSVFERLGPASKNLSDDTPTSTVLGDTVRVKKVGKPLSYQGVLKITSGNRRIITTGKASSQNRTVLKPMELGLKSPSKIISLKRINNILQSSTNESQGRLKNPPASGVQSRLGVKIDARNLARSKILLKSPKAVGIKKTSNVFDRLGNL